MKIRKATMADLDVVVDILRDGRNQLAERGVDQWQGDYPNVTHVKEDIENGYAYIVKADDGQTVGTLAIVEAPDRSISSSVSSKSKISRLLLIRAS